jgi:hypothetical protein
MLLQQSAAAFAMQGGPGTPAACEQELTVCCSSHCGCCFDTRMLRLPHLCRHCARPHLFTICAYLQSFSCALPAPPPHPVPPG